MRFLFVLLLLPALAWAEPATTIRQVDVKKAPAADADTIGQLAENTAVDALERKGGNLERGRCCTLARRNRPDLE